MYPLHIELTNAEKSIAYGYSLDRQDFKRINGMLSPDVAYYNFDNGLTRGPNEVSTFIADSRNEYTRQLDDSHWEQSYISPISDNIILVHFECQMYASGQKFVHHCTQRLYFNDQGQINMIDFIDEPAEKRALQEFLEKATEIRKRA